MTILKFTFVSLFSIFCFPLTAQPYFFQSNELPIEKNGEELLLAWAGGVNSPQLSAMDFDMDGLIDIVLFDRTDSNLVLLRNNGSGGTTAYRYDFRNEGNFPRMRLWSLFRDFNNDGLMDIFTGGAAICKLYENTSTDGNIEFTFLDSLWTDPYGNGKSTIYASKPDIPVIDDIDGDGDLDWLGFHALGLSVMYYENEGTPEEPEFQWNTDCFGDFKEDGFTNTITLNDCASNLPPAKSEMHGASSLAVYDLDNDGDKELFIGDFTYNQMLMLTNGGTAEDATMVSIDSAFPSTDVPIDVKFPSLYFADVDQDGATDMICSPNASNFDAPNAESMWFYKNHGTTELPDFQFEQTDIFQSQMVEVGRDAKPELFDYNGDGLLDLVIGNHHRFLQGEKKSSITLYENIGSSTAPSFKYITDDYGSFSSLGLGEGMDPTFGDLDDDGDKDLIIGMSEGELYYFENNPVANVANFTLSATDYFGIDVGAFASPQLFDLDGDSLLDLIIGEKDGYLNYYKNEGTASVPDFVMENNKFGNIFYKDVPRSSPNFFYDGDTLKLMLGTKDKGLQFYDQIGVNETDTFNLVNASVTGTVKKYNTSGALADLNGDGYPELLLGLLRGGMHFYQGLSPDHIGLEEEEGSKWEIYPNPSKNIVYIQGDDTPQLISIYNLQGQRVGDFTDVKKIEIGYLKSGIYLMSISNGTSIQTERIVKY